MTNRRALAFGLPAAAIGLVFVTAARGQSRSGPAPLRIAVNMTTIESAPVFVAAAGGPDAGIVIGAGGIPQLVAGEADAATNAETQALLRSVASPNLRTVLTVAECYYPTVARRSARI